ncbi:MAG: ABC transporter ATP-binding protein [Mariniblastus sp.]
MIDVKDFCKAYDNDAIAVDRLSFSLLPGQVLGLVGRNGAGKTTTLRALTGIIPSSGGTLSVGGFEINRDPLQVKKMTAYVPDDPQLFGDLTVLQHLQFQASVYGIRKPGSEITRLLEMFELETKRNSAASSLSRGMRQKLAICCAYLQNPKALLLDEPMTGLDPQAIRVLKQSVIQQADAGVAVVISSHLLAMVEDICTHVLVLNSGNRKFFGTLEELREKFSTGDGHDDSGSLEHAFFSALSQVETAVGEELHPGQPSSADSGASIPADILNSSNSTNTTQTTN